MSYRAPSDWNSLNRAHQSTFGRNSRHGNGGNGGGGHRHAPGQGGGRMGSQGRDRGQNRGRGGRGRSSNRPLLKESFFRDPWIGLEERLRHNQNWGDSGAPSVDERPIFTSISLQSVTLIGSMSSVESREGVMQQQLVPPPPAPPPTSNPPPPMPPKGPPLFARPPPKRGPKHPL